MVRRLTGGLIGFALSCIAAAGLAATARAGDITGAGATFPYPVYAKWAEAYKAETGIAVNYQSIGSGGGIKQIKARTVDFGASDMPLSGQALDAAGLIQFPAVMGGVVPVYNLPGIAAGAIRFSGPLLADIFLGKVAKWSDPAIAALNPGVTLPDKAIVVVHRSDGSGTTFIWTHYLGEVSPEWQDKVGAATAVEWPVGIGGKGNEGVAAFVQKAAGAIGYVEYAFARHTRLAFGQMRNKAGRFVTPDSASFQAAAANADWNGTPGFGVVLTDQPGEASWPITAATFILMRKMQEHADRGRQVLDFFAWGYASGDRLATELDYVPLPEPVVKLIEASWAETIKDASGRPIWPLTQ